MKMKTAVLLAATLAGPPAHAQVCELWVAPPPEGNDANPGTFAQPLATLNTASARALSGGGSNCVVTFKDGVYTGANSLDERFATPTIFRAANRYRAVLQSSTRAAQLFGARNMVFEGFEFRHTGAGAEPLVVQVQKSGNLWSENITFRDNVFHDSWNNDILKINNGARFIRVEGNVFYNQTGSDEHIDVNSVTDVVIEDNIFFNDFPGSGRPNLNDTSSYIVIKDSNDGDDNQIGSERIVVRRNLFLNWQGSAGSNFVLVGEDGKPYHEAVGVTVENNLMLGNAPNEMRSPFGVKGGRLVTFRSNTVAGDLPSCAYGMRLNREGSNPVNQDIVFRGNIWSDSAGTMGAGCAGGNDFSDGAPAETVGAVLDRNLYWNGGAAIPPGDVLSPLVHDARRVVANSGINANQAGVLLPRWTGTAFPSGSATIRQEFERLVATYAVLPAGSPALDVADAGATPQDDILGRPRAAGGAPDLGAYERIAGLAPAITPTTGPAAGGERITITGGPFLAPPGARFGDVLGTDPWFGSSTFIKVTAPALPAGTLHNVVVFPGNTTMPAAYMADFLDVPRSHVFHRFVERLLRGGITGGCGGGNYCPDSAVLREQMAVFLLRSQEGPSYLPPPCTVPTFADVPCSSPFAPWIEELVRRQVTGGCGGGLYCPTGAVTREQMAVLLLRTRFGSTYVPPACTTATFTDVPCSSVFARWIYDLVARGITGGCGGNAYCPTQPATRGQMAVFLAATFGL